MLWLLAIHIAALLAWCAALLCLPVLIGSERSWAGSGELHRPFDGVERFVYTHLATPAALVAIMSGTVVFLLNRTVEGWLVVKLTLVTGLVVCHVLVGSLVLRLERAATVRVRLWTKLVAIAVVVLVGAVLWLVLAKPGRALVAVP